MKIFSTIFAVVFAAAAFAGGDVYHNQTRFEKTFVTNNKWMPDKTYQAELRNQPSWKSFLSRNGKWWVIFNEENQKPHRAYGQPVSTSGSTIEDRARNFIANELVDFHIPVTDLQLQGISENDKQKFVNFFQQYQGIKVLESRLTVKMTNDFKVIMFGADVYHDINISISPSISSGAAGSAAMSGITESIVSTVVQPELAILPVPVNKNYEYHLVYVVQVKTMDTYNIPSDFYTLVDAVSGEVLYRQNRVHHFHDKHKNIKAMTPGGIDVSVNANLYTTQPYNPATSEALANLEFTVNGNTFNTDLTGNASTGITGPQSATFKLQGLWSIVSTNGVTPTQTTTLADGPNTFSFTSGTIQERSAYYNVNIVHDHCNAVLPSFTGMDWQLPTKVDLTTGNCNAFYDGSAINFYAQANGCTSFAEVGDVVYHEYGHGINDNFYQAGGSFFQNGAMGEGYADFWAFSITQNAVLGYGTSTTNATDYVRRYDQNRKVYPINIVGEVHADGEIIAGAWWDTYLNLGSDMNHTLQLFAGAYPGFQAAIADGQEGKAYTDVLIDVLQYDDNDGDLTNGTPNGLAIVDAFALHGITLISNASLAHTPLSFANSGNQITINATLSLNFPYTDYLQAVNCYFKVNNGSYFTAPMTASGNNYSVDIPAQPVGTVIAYYLGAEDINGLLTAVKPVGADQPDPNIPYFILVGYQLKKTDDVGDFLTEFGNWQTGLSSDNNTTGTWEANIPVGSFSTVGDTSTAVQPYYQHTPAGELCFITGNASSTTDALGTNDVDGGRTTLQSSNIDMTGYTNPTITYYRWYINNPPSGANPNADWWQVAVSNDGGTNWTYVENSKTSDRSWRRYAFRVSDYITPTATMKIRFVASDSTHLGQNLDGGSLVEAAVDDIQLWDNVNANSVDEQMADNMQFYLMPNPSTGLVNIMFEVPEETDVKLTVVDLTGKQVMDLNMKNLSPGLTNRRIDLSMLESGIYQVNMIFNGQLFSRKLVLTK